MRPLPSYLSLMWLNGCLRPVLSCAVLLAALAPAARAETSEEEPLPLSAVGEMFDGPEIEAEDNAIDNVSWNPLDGIEDLGPARILDPFGDVQPRVLQVLPDGLIYRSYLAGVREPRMASVWNFEKDGGWVWDISLGGRVGILRWGTTNDFRPEGWQLDIEGAGLPRLDIEEERDVVATDYRFGIPLTYGYGWYQMKVGYYHLSSHLGDEYVLKRPGITRFNYSRDVFIWGHSIDLTDTIRVYGETGYAYRSDVSEPWEFQFGMEITPPCPTGLRGGPFFALNTHLREEVDFGGNVVVQTGWLWRGGGGNHTFRTGVQYFNGKSDQFSLWNETEEKLGLGIWYDY